MFSESIYLAIASRASWLHLDIGSEHAYLWRASPLQGTYVYFPMRGVEVMRDVSHRCLLSWKVKVLGNQNMVRDYLRLGDRLDVSQLDRGLVNWVRLWRVGHLEVCCDNFVLIRSHRASLLIDTHFEFEVVRSRLVIPAHIIQKFWWRRQGKFLYLVIIRVQSPKFLLLLDTARYALAEGVEVPVVGCWIEVSAWRQKLILPLTVHHAHLRLRLILCAKFLLTASV